MGGLAVSTFLTSPWLWSLLGLIALAILLWIVGPLISVGAGPPFSTATGRYGAIGFMVVVWAIIRALRAWRARRTNRAILDGLASSAPEAPSGPAPGEAESAEELATIRSRFEEAMEVLIV